MTVAAARLPILYVPQTALDPAPAGVPLADGDSITVLLRGTVHAVGDEFHLNVKGYAIAEPRPAKAEREPRESQA